MGSETQKYDVTSGQAERSFVQPLTG